MSELFNIYCDESCHLENDEHRTMLLGAIHCKNDKVKEAFARLKEIKKKHNLKEDFEVKWTKVSESKINFYLEWLDYFLDDDDLNFRAIIIKDKNELNHSAYDQTHDDWYFKMYFDLLKVIIAPESKYKIYLDIKDTRSADKARQLREVLCRENYDFKREIISELSFVRSEQVQLIQLADLLIGAVGYHNRRELYPDNQSKFTNMGKIKFIERIKERTGYSLSKTTLLKEQKFNLFFWQPEIRD